MTRPLRFGLVGTGHWAQITHAPALASTDGIEFAAVWGRNSGAAGELAGRCHATAYDDISAFLANVDAVAFAVPRSPSARPRRASTCCLKSPLRSPRRMGMP
jgi:predicted dehydrogenase